MDLTQGFRSAMLRRFLEAVGATAIGVPLVATAALTGCGGKVVFDGRPSSSGTGGSGGAAGTASGGDGGAGGAGGNCSYSSTGVGGDEIQVTECFAPPDGVTCPNQYQATQYLLPSNGCNYVVSIDCGPMVLDVNKCCYLTTEEPMPCEGRPYRVGDEARTAWAEIRSGGWSEEGLAPDVTGLSLEARAALADAYTTAALAEHASVASFARFALDLMAVGAPSDLVTAAHEAALDEVRHARLCFALAGGYRGVPVSPSAFPFQGSVPITKDLATLAAETARDGCINETVAAVRAAEELARATDPAVKRALAIIARDEARHAELAFRAVTWALENGDDSVRRAVVEVFSNAARHLSFGSGLDEALSPAVAAAHGRLDGDDERKTVVRALAEVVIPCAAALLERTSPPPSVSAWARSDEPPLTMRSPA